MVMGPLTPMLVAKGIVYWGSYVHIPTMGSTFGSAVPFVETVAHPDTAKKPMTIKEIKMSASLSTKYHQYKLLYLSLKLFTNRFLTAN
jgi:hypothetical protein